MLRVNSDIEMWQDFLLGSLIISEVLRLLEVSAFEFITIPGIGQASPQHRIDRGQIKVSAVSIYDQYKFEKWISANRPHLLQLYQAAHTELLLFAKNGH